MERAQQAAVISHVQASGISLEAVASALHVDRTLVSHWKAGRRTMSRDQLLRLVVFIADELAARPALECPTAVLLGAATVSRETGRLSALAAEVASDGVVTQAERIQLRRQGQAVKRAVREAGLGA